MFRWARGETIGQTPSYVHRVPVMVEDGLVTEHIGVTAVTWCLRIAR